MRCLGSLCGSWRHHLVGCGVAACAPDQRTHWPFICKASPERVQHGTRLTTFYLAFPFVLRRTARPGPGAAAGADGAAFAGCALRSWQPTAMRSACMLPCGAPGPTAFGDTHTRPRAPGARGWRFSASTRHAMPRASHALRRAVALGPPGTQALCGTRRPSASDREPSKYTGYRHRQRLSSCMSRIYLHFASDGIGYVGQTVLLWRYAAMMCRSRWSVHVKWGYSRRVVALV